MATKSTAKPTGKKGPNEALTPEEEQQKFLETAKANVQREAFKMKRALDDNQLMEALKHASTMLSEMRTGELTPKNYYDLYIVVFDQLRYLEMYLMDEKRKGRNIAELYELVQYAGNIVPRLYLLVTVGSVYIQKNGETNGAPAKDVLKDLVEMCRGVQHPTRGLFLRNYLSELLKTKLPDKGSEYEGVGGDVRDAIDFILINFTEMNKLWVRMQHQGPMRDKEKREAERQELRILVGKNLTRLSQLDGVDGKLYAELVLPKLLEQVVSCRDQIAQQYLMECITMVFPDAFHLITLEKLLSTITQLQPGVNVMTIVVSLIERLANYIAAPPEERGGAAIADNPPTDNVFEIFHTQLAKVIEQRKNIPTEDVLAMENSLLNLCLRCYRDRHAQVDAVLQFTADFLAAQKQREIDLAKPAVVKQLRELLAIPLKGYNNVRVVLELEHFAGPLKFLAYDQRKKVAREIAENVLMNETRIPTSEEVNKLLELLAPLVRDDPDHPEFDADKLDKEDLEEEQTLLARLIHLFDTPDLPQLSAIMVTARKHFGAGGPLRLRYTLPPLVFKALKLTIRFRPGAPEESTDADWGTKGKKVFQFANETVNALIRTNHHSVALRLFLQCAHAADLCGFGAIAYDFLTNALVIYEDDVSDSKSQYQVIQLFIGTLQNFRSLGRDNYDTMITKVALHSAKQVKRTAQCRAVALCSHLFWQSQMPLEGAYREPQRVLECMQKSLRIADSCSTELSSNLHLFVEILNECLYHFEQGNEAINATYVNALIALINTKLANREANEESAKVNIHVQNTYRHIAAKRESGEKNSSAFREIVL